MRRFILSIVLIITVAATLLAPGAAVADHPGKIGGNVDAGSHRISPNAVTQYTGRQWYSAAQGQQVYEYKIRIDAAPAYIDNQLIDTTWHSKSSTKYEAGTNLFRAKVTGGITTVTYNGQDMVWSPQVFVGQVEYKCPNTPTLLSVDPINSNYHSNTLSWDYGVCERRLRLIEGMISETYVFKTDPGSDVQIKSNVIKDDNFVGECPVYAYDAAGASIPISSDKIIKATDLRGAAYPVTIDPTETYYTSASDGYCQHSDALPYNTIWTAASSTSAFSSYTTNTIGQSTGASYSISRAAFYFDTSAIPDAAIITSGNLSLYGQSDHTTTDFNITLQTGAPTFPHDPLAVGDYFKDNYTGDGGNKSTSLFTTSGYNNISLTATGLTWVDKTGTTKFIIRSSRDIAGTAPGGDEYLTVYSYEQGAGYRPYLEVTYTSASAPTVSTNPASYITKTTAQLNGYLSADGGETCNASFEWSQSTGAWYNSSWKNRIQLTINGSYVSSSLTNFPVLITGAQINSTDPNFFAAVNANGSDIVVTASDQVTKLNRELVSLNKTAYTMELWANVTAVAATTNTTLYLYYNNSAGAETNSTATWDPNYVAVYHMNDNPNTSTIKDSTVNNFSGVKVGAGEPVQIAGVFAGDMGQHFDASNDYISIADMSGKLTSTRNMTVTLVATIDTDIQRCIFDIYGSVDVAPYGRMYLWSKADKTLWRGTGYTDNTNTDTSTGVYTNGSPFHASVTYNGTQNFYYNGTAGTASAVISKDLYTGAKITYIGRCRPGDPQPFDGKVYEFRISNTNRSPGWIAATYYTILKPTLFCPGVATVDYSSTYTAASTASQPKTVGQSFYVLLTGLSGNTYYGYRSVANNSIGVSYGNWSYFTTLASSMPPTNFSAYPSATTVDLIWQNGAGSAGTIVRYKIGAYPSNTSDGLLIYNGSISSYTHTSLIPGTNYYYCAWGDDGAGSYSDTYSSVLVTTLAGSATVGATPEAPLAPNGWFGAPDYTHMSNMPGYDLINAGADSVSMPRNSAWMLLAILGAVGAGVIAFFLTKHNPLIAVLVSAVFLAMSGTQGLISWWYVGIYLIAALAFSFKAITR